MRERARQAGYVHMLDLHTYVFDDTDNTKVRISSSTKKHIPIYECDVVFTPAPYASNPKQATEMDIESH